MKKSKDSILGPADVHRPDAKEGLQKIRVGKLLATLLLCALENITFVADANETG